MTKESALQMAGNLMNFSMSVHHYMEMRSPQGQKERWELMTMQAQSVNHPYEKGSQPGETSAQRLWV